MNGMPPTIPKALTARGGWAAAFAFIGWVLVGIYFLAAAVVLVTRYWILPNIGAQSEKIEQAVSQALGERVTIGRINARWEGLHPELDLSQVNVHDKEGNVALSLPAVEAIIGWRSILFLSLRLHSLVIDQPDLNIRRDSSGRIFIAGVELRSDRSDSGAGDWLLVQNDVVIRNARLAWSDERRGAPPLELLGVTLRLQNSGDTHRFSLRAQADQELSSALDVRGEFRGESFANIGAWKGLVYAELDYVDLAGWKRWIDYPMDLVSGKGGLRLWLTTDGERVTEVNADVALANVRARLAEDLPMLDLEYLHGRLGGSRAGANAPRPMVRAHGNNLTLKSTRGNAMPPADFSLMWEGAGAGNPEKGELQANSLEFEPLANLAEFLPFPKKARARLEQMAPRGSVNEMKLTWTGEVENLESYALRGRFSKVDMKAPGGWGAVSGLSGELNANKAGGNVRINSDHTMIELPDYLPEGRAFFDKLAAQIGWTTADGQVDVKFSNLSLTNKDGVGNLSGSYSTRSKYPKSPGVVDISGQFPRLDAAAVYRYIPRLPRSVTDYLRDSIVSGQAADGQLRLKGDLQDFPYTDEKSGIFRASARVSKGEFRYAEGWPRLADLNAEINIDRSRLQVASPRATVLGARATNVRVQVPDLFSGDERVLVEGLSEGPTAEFLRFIDASPVAGYIDGATKEIRATGAGRLQLKLDIPVRRLAQTKVTGAYQVLANSVDIEGGVPPLNQVNGRIDFSESGMLARGMTAQMLGGPITFGMSTRAGGGVDVEAQGNSGIAAVAKFFELPMLDRASGSSPWRSTMRIAKEGVDVTVESTLAGISIALPDPLNKAPAEVWPTRLEYSSRADAEFLRRLKLPRQAAGSDSFFVALGSRAAGVLTRRKNAKGYELDRGAIGVGEPVPAMERAGISIAARVGHVDVDRWRGLLDAGARGENIATNLSLTAATLDFAGKRLNDVRMRAAPVGSAWAVTIASRELAGSVTWRPEGAGRVVARLKHFTVPDSPPGPLPAEVQSTELPALDIIADSFTLNEKSLGRLELVAVNEVRDWRIEKLALTTAEGALGATGVWQSWAQRPSVNLNINLDLVDVGGFLSRLGHGGTMKGGKAKLTGKVGWLGNPQSLDYPTLSGNIALSADNGQFLKAEPGIAKLLGILSLQTWITLDFRGLFGEGFSFDTITGSANINNGVLATQDFSMNGRTAKVSMSGTINIAQETQNLKVRVVPSIGDGASSIVALTAANPALGLVALLLQRILGDPVGKIFAFDYTVLGTWSDPKVERTNIQTPAVPAETK